jgi:hypothetical protein
MFVRASRGYTVDMAKISKQLSPDEVQIKLPCVPVV